MSKEKENHITMFCCHCGESNIVRPLIDISIGLNMSANGDVCILVNQGTMYCNKCRIELEKDLRELLKKYIAGDL